SPKVSSHLLYCQQSLVIPVLSAVSGHPCTVCSLWSSLCCPQSLVIPVLSASLVISCAVSAVSGHLCTVVSGHLLYCVCSLWSSPVLCPQSLVISCAVRSLWSSPVLCLQ
ncbi:unnamed protein product, partial [Staurois parvus]